MCPANAWGRLFHKEVRQEQSLCQECFLCLVMSFRFYPSARPEFRYHPSVNTLLCYFDPAERLGEFRSSGAGEECPFLTLPSRLSGSARRGRGVEKVSAGFESETRAS